jgi:hypothetical protein
LLAAVMPRAIRDAAKDVTHGFLQSPLLELESDETPVPGTRKQFDRLSQS